MFQLAPILSILLPALATFPHVEGGSHVKHIVGQRAISEEGTSETQEEVVVSKHHLCQAEGV